MTVVGAFGTGSFDNDDALDLVCELDHVGNVSPLASAFVAVLDVEADYDLDQDDVFRAVAAAEFVAAGLGHPSRRAPESLLEWTAERAQLLRALAPNARRALNRIRSGPAEPAGDWLT